MPRSVRSQELIILAVPQQIVGLCFDLIAVPDQAACFVNDHLEHANGRRIKSSSGSGNPIDGRAVSKTSSESVSC